MCLGEKVPEWNIWKGNIRVYHFLEWCGWQVGCRTSLWLSVFHVQSSSSSGRLKENPVFEDWLFCSTSFLTICLEYSLGIPTSIIFWYTQVYITYLTLTFPRFLKVCHEGEGEAPHTQTSLFAGADYSALQQFIHSLLLYRLSPADLSKVTPSNRLCKTAMTQIHY